MGSRVAQKAEKWRELGLAKPLPRLARLPPLPPAKYCDVCEMITDHRDTSSAIVHSDGLRARQRAKHDSEQRIAATVLAAMKGASPAPPARETANGSPPAPAPVTAAPRKAPRIEGFVGAREVMEALKCERSTAYRYLREAAGRSAGTHELLRVPVSTWERYAKRKFPR